jgi:hypothetical protein
MQELRPELMGAAIGGWLGPVVGLVLMGLGYGALLHNSTPGDAYAAGVLAGAAGGLGLGVIFSAIHDEAGRAAVDLK